MVPRYTQLNLSRLSLLWTERISSATEMHIEPQVHAMESSIRLPFQQLLRTYQHEHMPSSIHTACLGSHLRTVIGAITASYSSYSLAHRPLSVTTRSPSGSGRASGSRRLAITSAHLSAHIRAQLQLLLACLSQSLLILFLSAFFILSYSLFFSQLSSRLFSL